MHLKEYLCPNYLLTEAVFALNAFYRYFKVLTLAIPHQDVTYFCQRKLGLSFEQ